MSRITHPPAIYSQVEYGVSDDANLLRSSYAELLGELVGKSALGLQYMRLHDDLIRLSEETGWRGWDGYGAERINPESLAFAQRLAQLLPFGYPAPEVTVDPDGEVSFDWNGGRRHHLSFSVSPHGTLRYAGITGDSSVYGREPWCDGIPEPVLRLVQRVAPVGS